MLRWTIVLLCAGAILYGFFAQSPQVGEVFAGVQGNVAASNPTVPTVNDVLGDVFETDVKDEERHTAQDVTALTRETSRILDRIDRLFDGMAGADEHALALTEEATLQKENHHATGELWLTGATYTWTFRNHSDVGVTFTKYRTRMWNWYPGAEPSDKEELKQKQSSPFRHVIVDKELPLEPPIRVNAGSTVVSPFRERPEIFRLVNLQIPYGVSLLHEFIGYDDQGREVRLEEATAKGFKK